MAPRLSYIGRGDIGAVRSRLRRSFRPQSRPLSAEREVGHAQESLSKGPTREAASGLRPHQESGRGAEQEARCLHGPRLDGGAGVRRGDIVFTSGTDDAAVRHLYEQMLAVDVRRKFLVDCSTITSPTVNFLDGMVGVSQGKAGGEVEQRTTQGAP